MTLSRIAFIIKTSSWENNGALRVKRYNRIKTLRENTKYGFDARLYSCVFWREVRFSFRGLYLPIFILSHSPFFWGGNTRRWCSRKHTSLPSWSGGFKSRVALHGRKRPACGMCFASEQMRKRWNFPLLLFSRRNPHSILLSLLGGISVTAEDMQPGSGRIPTPFWKDWKSKVQILSVAPVTMLNRVGAVDLSEKRYVMFCFQRQKIAYPWNCISTVGFHNKKEMWW